MLDRPPMSDPQPEQLDFESILEDYPVRLQNFEGPLDLLLHLIKKNELDIYDIPIALVTQQYLDYLDLMQELNLDVAGEFLVMAATLIHIKSRMLLPRPDPTQEDPDEDPREALVRRLLEHQKFKAAAELLHEREIQRSAQWGRPDGRVAAVVGEPPEPEVEVDLFSLMAAFRQVLERARQRPVVLLPPEFIDTTLVTALRRELPLLGVDPDAVVRVDLVYELRDGRLECDVVGVGLRDAGDRALELRVTLSDPIPGLSYLTSREEMQHA